MIASTNHTIDSPSLSERISSFLLIALAVWTLLAHSIGFLFNGTFDHLFYGSISVPFITFFLFHTLYKPEINTVPTSEPTYEKPNWYAFGFTLALVALFETLKPYSPNGRMILLWGGAMIFLLVMWLHSLNKQGIRILPSPTTPYEKILFGIVILSVALITLLAHRPDMDDRIYLGMATITIDNPDLPLLSRNGLLWGNDLPVLVSTYRLSSFELLAAFFARLGSVEPIVVAHLFLPTVFALWTVIAHSQLLRLLAPKKWLTLLIIVLFLLLGLGGEIRGGFSNFSFVQLQFGKSVLISAIIPLLILFATQFMIQGTKKAWLLLFLGQIAAVGCSSSAIFMAPMAVGLTLVANWRMDIQITRRLFVGLSSCLYLIIVGLLMKASVVQQYVLMTSNPFSIINNFTKVFGQGPHMWLFLASAIGSWTLVSNPGLRRFLLGLSFIFVALILNPFLQPFLMKNATGLGLFWRLFLTIPLPFMAAVLILSPFLIWSKNRLPNPAILYLGVVGLLVLAFSGQWRALWISFLPMSLTALVLLPLLAWNKRWHMPVSWITFIATLALLLHYGANDTPRKNPLSYINHTAIHLPTYKTPPDIFPAAHYAKTMAPPGKSVLAPRGVAIWIPVMRHSPLLVATQLEHHKLIGDWLEKGGIQRRTTLLKYVSGEKKESDSLHILQQSIPLYQIGMVIAPISNPWLLEMDTTLLANGFQKEEKFGYRYWINHTPLNREK